MSSVSEMLNMDNVSKNMNKKLSKKNTKEIIEECGKLYNFDSKEVLKRLNLYKEKKEKLLIPFDGKIKEGCCKGIVKNHGLYTQCEKKVE